MTQAVPHLTLVSIIEEQSGILDGGILTFASSSYCVKTSTLPSQTIYCFTNIENWIAPFGVLAAVAQFIANCDCVFRKRNFIRQSAECGVLDACSTSGSRHLRVV